MLMTCAAIAAGGALGALARYGISQIPFLSGHGFPWMTLAANLIGALIIGFIAGAMLTTHKLSANQQMFLKTGFCGALTTFSTFSLETVVMFDNGRYLLAAIYIFASIILCIVGVFAGRALAMHCLSA